MVARIGMLRGAYVRIRPVKLSTGPLPPRLRGHRKCFLQSKLYSLFKLFRKGVSSPAKNLLAPIGPFLQNASATLSRPCRKGLYPDMLRC
jgi:hypothetical protein